MILISNINKNDRSKTYIFQYMKSPTRDYTPRFEKSIVIYYPSETLWTFFVMIVWQPSGLRVFFPRKNKIGFIRRVVFLAELFPPTPRGDNTCARKRLALHSLSGGPAAAALLVIGTLRGKSLALYSPPTITAEIWKYEYCNTA